MLVIPSITQGSGKNFFDAVRKRELDRFADLFRHFFQFGLVPTGHDYFI
jgi:hypothetical protein